MKKVVVGILIVALVLLGSGALFYKYVASRDFFFSDIQVLVKQETGYTITKLGPLEFSLTPRPTVTIRDLTVTNYSAASHPVIANVGIATVFLHWAPLLHRELVVDLDIDSASLNLQVNTAGQSNWVTDELLVADDEPLFFKLDKANLSETFFGFNNYSTDEVLELELESFDVDLSSGITSARLNSVGQAGGFQFSVMGDAEYLSQDKQLVLSLELATGKALPLDREGEQGADSLPLHGLLQGSLHIEDMLPRGDLSFDFSVDTMDDFIYLADELKYLNQGLGPADALGVLRLNGSDLDIAELQVGLRQNQLNMEIAGEIQNLLSDVQLELEVGLEASKFIDIIAPESVEGHIAQLAPDVGPVNLSAAISRNADGMSINMLDVEFAYKSFSSAIVGDLNLMQGDILFDFDIRADADETEDLFSLLNIDPINYVGSDFRDYGSFGISTKISGSQDQYHIEQALAVLQDGNVQTTIAGEVGLTEAGYYFDLNSTLAIEEGSQLIGLFPKEFEPHLGGLGGSVNSNLKGTVENFSLSKMEIDLVSQSQELQIQGDLLNLPMDPLPNLDFRYTTKHAIELEQYFPKLVDLQLVGPLALAGTIRDVENNIRIDNIRLDTQETDLQGNIVVDRSDSPPRITIVLGAEQFANPLFEIEPDTDPSEIEQEVTEESETQEENTLSGEELGELFKAYTAGVKLETDWVDDLNFYFRFTAGKAKIGKYDLEGLVLAVDARDGVFELVEYQVLHNADPLSVRGSIDTNTESPTYRVAGDLKGDSIEALAGLDEGVLLGGELNGEFRLESRGAYLSDLIENLEGRAVVAMGPLSIKSNALNFVSVSIFSSMLEGILSRKEDEPTSYYQCGVLGIEVENGVASIDKAFTLQSERYNLAGSGEVDFNTGFVDISVAPRARTGLGLSISTLVGGFTIQGHMATPDFGVGGAFVSAVVTGYLLAPAAAAASATNPVTASILATGYVAKGLFDRLTSSRYTCENTLKRIDSG